MTPGQLANAALTYFFFAIRLGERPHIFEVCLGKAADIGKLPLQIFSQALNDLATPALILLAGQDFVTDLPVEMNELLIDGEGCLDLGRADA